MVAGRTNLSSSLYRGSPRLLFVNGELLLTRILRDIRKLFPSHTMHEINASSAFLRLEEMKTFGENVRLLFLKHDNWSFGYTLWM